MQRTQQQRRGAVVVEFALVATLVILVIFSMFEFSWVNVMRHTADNAAYEASRFGIVPGANVAEVEDKAQDYLDSVRVVGATITVAPDPITEETANVSVSVDIPLARNSWIIPDFTKNASVSASSTLRAERYRGIPDGS